MHLTESAIAAVEKVKNGKFPVHIVSVAQEHGIGVFGDPNYPNDGNGHIELRPDRSLAIIVNIKQSPERQRFTIAHEIGHFFMDMDYLAEHKYIDRDGDASDPSYRRRERRANEFAASILMPEEAFIAQWIALGDLQKVADYFGVSKSSAQVRAVILGLTKAD
ncbi:MAG: ImmA/IrrE family metallo-endopeptidase [Alphaproteobacteria bacterium]